MASPTEPSTKPAWTMDGLDGPPCFSAGLTDAQRLAKLALENSPVHPGFAAHALHLLGDLATHPDQFNAEQGEYRYCKALTLAEARGMRPLVAHCHLGLSKLYQRTASKSKPTSTLPRQ